MNSKKNQILFIIISICLIGCATVNISESIILTKEDKIIADSIKINHEKLIELKSKPLFRFSENEIDSYIKYLNLTEPCLAERIKHIGMKNIGQPYELYLLGEFPYEIYDEQPLYCLEKSDCVVFVEHTYAMALATDWNSFFYILQKIRYKNGEIKLTKRNHYANLDWNINNKWLVTDICDSLVNSEVDTNKTVYNKSRFFKRWGLDLDIPLDSLVWNYISAVKIDSIKDSLQTGDLVQIVRGTDIENGKWVGHFGMIVKDKGIVNLLHSTPPEVRMEPLLDYVNNGLTTNKIKRQFNKDIQQKNERIEKYNDKLSNSLIRKYILKKKKKLKFKPYFYGLKFLRLNNNPLKIMEKSVHLSP